jgi:hypothetical protein
MDGESHEGVVSFEPQPSGRETVMLGRVQVGEIAHAADPRGRFKMCFRLLLPDSAAAPWQPAADRDAARRGVLVHINDWLNAADVRPNGTSHAE